MKNHNIYLYLPLTLFFLLSSCTNQDGNLKSELVRLQSEIQRKDLVNDSLKGVIQDLSLKIEELLSSDPINSPQEIDYTDLNILKLIRQFGPLEFIKENGLWYILSVDLVKGKFHLLKIPVMKVYGNNLEYTEIMKEYLENNQYILERSNSFKLKNIVDVGYNYEFKKNVSFEEKDVELRDGTVRIKGVITNLTPNRINGVKLEVSLYSSPFKGELLQTREVIINQTIDPSELQTIDYNYSTGVISGYSFLGYNIEYISYF